ncbi:MAG: NADH-quinone oxidoreductase subunit L [Actinobacteria bacterium]|nr:NADH-quinone oxidoreductase subunit L [Actinomycetota bacterium]
MLGLLFLIPLIPFSGFAVLALGGRWLRPRGLAAVGAGSVGLSALLSLVIGASFLLAPPPGHVYSQTLWTWMHVGGFAPGVSFYLDALSLVMILVISVVSFLIHLYSTSFMTGEEGYRRFFAYMNLFVGSMLTLVLADNLLLLYLGWEGVGMCSYLLIGFWYKDPVNGRAARKAFIVTRVGDTAMAIALFLLFTSLGTLRIPDLLRLAALHWQAGSGVAVAAALLLLGGAVGKSAQLPLQTWLPDAMAGPTPVSALIHAATMVTAGVYLIARTNEIFILAPDVRLLVGVVGAVTLLLAGFSALTQHDIKRVLAYSTISQIGYMFLALGVGAWSAAIFHFMTHAFFKALLFLGAGVVIQGLGQEHDMFRMGGLRKELPLAFWTFLIGSASLSALPLITAGFYSKDLILWDAWSSRSGSPWLWAAGIAGAFLTSIYTFRMVFLTFFGRRRGEKVGKKPGMSMHVPLVVLAVLSIIGGFVELPGLPVLSNFLGHALPALAQAGSAGLELVFELIAAAASLGGIYVAYHFFLRRPERAGALAESAGGRLLHRWWFAGWGFDWIYGKVFVAPYAQVARVAGREAFDLVSTGLAWLAAAINRLLARSQTGRVRWYAGAIAAGAIIILALVATS